LSKPFALTPGPSPRDGRGEEGVVEQMVI